MTITNTQLNQVAKSLAGESYLIPAFASIGTTDVLSIATTATTLEGDVGPRIGTTATRTGANIEFSAIRSSVYGGVPIKTVGFFTGDQSTDALLFGVVVSGVTQTTSFDLEIIGNIEVRR